jgi:cyclic pyranopterin phosphate synthase
MMDDLFGRKIDYLRISLTPRCNLRCVYCLPPQNPPGLSDRNRLLSPGEIVLIVEAAAELGVRRVRFTGGEPLLRQELIEIVARVAEIPGIEDISLSTNGILLEKKAKQLAEAGLNRVNISLDTLNAEKYHCMTRGGDLARVWRGIQAAEDAGLAPIKLNTVVVGGINDDEILEIASLTRENPWQTRFIELMPFVRPRDWGIGISPDQIRVIKEDQILSKLAKLNLVPAGAPDGHGPARYYRIPNSMGRIGLITPSSNHFCGSCNRLRVTADGFLRPCLLHDEEINLRDGFQSTESIKELMRTAVLQKPRGHALREQKTPNLQVHQMAQIGG